MNLNKFAARIVLTIATVGLLPGGSTWRISDSDNGTKISGTPKPTRRLWELPLLGELLSARISFVSHVAHAANIIEELNYIRRS